AIELVGRLWAEDRVTFDGQYYQTRNATVYDKPEQPVPLYVAGSGPAAARLAGRVADGFICTSGKAPNLYSETLLPAVMGGIGKAERDPNEVELMIEMKVSFDSDRDRAQADTKHWAALALSPEEKTGVEDPLEMERLADELPVERAATRWIVSDDPDEQVERIKSYLALGFTHLVFHAPGPDQERFLRLYAKEVLPRLRALA
ncbi:MAG: LLM class flavin-dependent oxidoreductase, partial [Thermomicrobiales bacterium]|nr:LLM class flavin-dependent oxidoreductase [Thermomicrobiales bacterium]